MVHEQGTCALSLFSQRRGIGGVDGAGEFRLRFGAVYRRVQGIDDDVRRGLANTGADLSRRRKIQSASVKSEQLSSIFEGAQQLASDLSSAPVTRTRGQESGKTSACLR